MKDFGKAIAIFMVVVDVLASGGYAYCHEWRRTIYWAAAAVLTASVTF